MHRFPNTCPCGIKKTASFQHWGAWPPTATPAHNMHRFPNTCPCGIKQIASFQRWGAWPPTATPAHDMHCFPNTCLCGIKQIASFAILRCLTTYRHSRTRHASFSQHLPMWYKNKQLVSQQWGAWPPTATHAHDMHRFPNTCPCGIKQIASFATLRCLTTYRHSRTRHAPFSQHLPVWYKTNS